MNYLLFFTACIMLTGTQTGWVLKKDNNGIQVYTRNENGTNIKELKVVTHMEAGLHSVIAVLDEVAVHPEWVYKCTSAKRLDLDQEIGYYYYVTIDFPFPAIDRDLVVFTRKEQDLNTGVVKTYSVAMPDVYPEQKGFIRIRQFNSSYTLTPMKRGQGLKLEYEMFTDPGGSIPDWMVNMAIARGPVKTMKNLEEFAKQEKYKKIKVAGIH